MVRKPGMKSFQCANRSGLPRASPLFGSVGASQRLYFPCVVSGLTASATPNTTRQSGDQVRAPTSYMTANELDLGRVDSDTRVFAGPTAAGRTSIAAV